MVIWNKELIYPNALKAPYKTFLTWRLFKEHFNTHKFSRHLTKHCSLVSVRVVAYSSNRKEHMMIYLHGVHGVGVHGFTLWWKIITNEYLKNIIVYRNWELCGAWKKKTITFGRSLMTLAFYSKKWNNQSTCWMIKPILLRAFISQGKIQEEKKSIYRVV